MLRDVNTYRMGGVMKRYFTNLLNYDSFFTINDASTYNLRSVRTVTDILTGDQYVIENDAHADLEKISIAIRFLTPPDASQDIEIEE